MNFTRRGTMKSTQTLNLVKFAACMVLAVGLSASALASCGDSLSAMAAGAASAQRQSRVIQPSSESAGDNEGKSSMVGLWHILFTVDDQTIQEAYQLWNAGGTEVHNPNVDPRGGSVCLGVWKHASHGAYKLAHRVKFVRKLLNVRSPQTLEFAEITALVPFLTPTPDFASCLAACFD